jgi:hypothetical protein
MAIADSFLSPSAQEQFNKGVSHLAKDFDIKVVTRVGMGSGLTSNVIDFNLTDQCVDHVMPFEWRLKQLVTRLLVVLKDANFKVGLQEPMTSFSLHITSDLRAPSPDEVMDIMQYNVKLATPLGDVTGAFFSLAVEAA